MEKTLVVSNHNSDLGLSSGQTYEKETALSGKGLTSFLKLFTDMALMEAPANSIVQIQPGSLYVDFEMVFQMGEGGVSKFKGALSHLKEQRYSECAAEMLDSRWANQTPNRAKSLAAIMENSNA